MLFFVVEMELGKEKMSFKHMCKQEMKKWGKLDLNQRPAGYESAIILNNTARSYLL
jgi:hypothetical protein